MSAFERIVVITVFAAVCGGCAEDLQGVASGTPGATARAQTESLNAQTATMQQWNQCIEAGHDVNQCGPAPTINRQSTALVHTDTACMNVCMSRGHTQGFCTEQCSISNPLAGEWISDKNGCKVWHNALVVGKSFTWSGPCLDGYADGTGILQWFKDDMPLSRYEGTMLRGKANGKGILIDKLGNHKEGEWVEGKRIGEVPPKLDIASCSTKHPSYPVASWRYKEQGTVVLGIFVDTSGTSKVEIAQSSGHARLDEAARYWVATCRFSPATYNGKPESAYTTQPYSFSMLPY